MQTKSLAISEEIKNLLEGFKLGKLGASVSGSSTLAPPVESIKIITNSSYILDRKKVYQVYWREMDGYRYLMYMAPHHRQFMQYCDLYLAAGIRLSVTKEDHFSYFDHGNQEVPVNGSVLVPENWDWGCKAKRTPTKYSEVVNIFKTIFSKIEGEGLKDLVDFMGWWEPSYASTNYEAEVKEWAKSKNLI